MHINLSCGDATGGDKGTAAVPIATMAGLVDQALRCLGVPLPCAGPPRTGKHGRAHWHGYGFEKFYATRLYREGKGGKGPAVDLLLRSCKVTQGLRQAQR